MRLFADTAPLRSTDFRRLLASGIVTTIGASLTIFAVPVQIYALTQSSAYVGLSGISALVPLIVFGLLGGAWADAMDRRLLLIIGSCGLAVALLAAAMSVGAVAAGAAPGRDGCGGDPGVGCDRYRFRAGSVALLTVAQVCCCGQR